MRIRNAFILIAGITLIPALGAVSEEQSPLDFPQEHPMVDDLTNRLITPDPWEPEPSKPEPWEPDPWEPEPSKPEPWEPDPWEPEPSKPEPWEPDPWKELEPWESEKWRPKDWQLEPWKRYLGDKLTARLRVILNLHDATSQTLLETQDLRGLHLFQTTKARDAQFRITQS